MYMYTDDLLSDSWSSSVHLCAHSGVPSSSNTTKPVANRQSSADQQHLREGQTMVWVTVINPHWNPETNGSMGKLWSSIPSEILKKYKKWVYESLWLFPSPMNGYVFHPDHGTSKPQYSVRRLTTLRSTSPVNLSRTHVQTDCWMLLGKPVKALV